MVGRLRTPPKPVAALGSQQQRRVQTNTAATEIATQELSFVTEPTTPSNGGSTSYRSLPINWAPETTFMVDSPGAADGQHFYLHPSVSYFTDMATNFASWYSPQKGINGPDAAPEDLPGTISQLMSSALTSGDAESASYWAYHLARTGFFTATAVTGAVAHHLAFQAQGLLQSLGLASGSSSSAASSSGEERPKTPLENLSRNAQAELLNRLQEALAVYRKDLQYIKDGKYKLPWDMTQFPTHKQFNPFYVARMTVDFCGEAVATLNRRLEMASADNWFLSNMYPQYYASNTFHYQSDGWLSSRSADVYEFSTETLFFGRQDAMQRTALLPLADFIRSRGLDPARMTVAEVGCGTGRFHTFIKDNFPTLNTIASDLSPFYLAKARDNIRYWKSQRAAQLDLGGPEGTGTTYIQAPMENLPVPDASLDAVVCIYCFHEMPESARLAAAKEWHRVLKPGGLVVLTDSVQLGDRSAWDKTLGNFGNLNEPHYRNYIACDMGSLFKSAGFNCDTKFMSSATKTWSFTKPDTPAAAAAPAAATSSSTSSSNGSAGAELN